MKTFGLIVLISCSIQLLIMAAYMDTLTFVCLSIELMACAGMGFHIWRIYQRPNEDTKGEE